MLQDAAARGKPLEDIPLHTCTCPPCFTEYMNNGKMECVPKCDLGSCDAATGVCNGGFGGSGGAIFGLFLGFALLILGPWQVGCWDAGNRFTC